MDKLRHQIDTLTPTVPDGMSRADIATFAVAMQVQGMAIALAELARTRTCSPDELTTSAAACGTVSSELLDGIG
jgi:hypothetical protein